MSPACRRTRAAASVVVLVAALAGGCVVELPLPGGGSTSPPAHEGAPSSPQEAEAPTEAERRVEEVVLDLANEVRQQAGMTELSRHPGLDQVARRWSQHLAGTGAELAHNPAVADQVPPGWSAVGENVGWLDDGGRLAPEDVAARVHEGWMDSPGHRENLMREGYTHLGVGVAHDPDHGYYLTQNFATY